MVTKNEVYEAAKHFVQNCQNIYPERDLMDEQTNQEFDYCLSIIQAHDEEQEKDFIQEKPKKQTRQKRKGKLELFEEQVIECLQQGFGEERQLLEEAYNRKNEFARRNYIKAYNRAVQRFQQNQR